MKTCQAYKEQIIFYEELSENEKKDLKKHLEFCKSCQKYFQSVNFIISQIKEFNQSNHIEEGMLSRYAVYRFAPDEPDFDGTRLSESEIRRIESHLARCVYCEEKLGTLMEEIEDLNSYLDETDLPDMVVGATSVIERVKEKFESLFDSISKILKNILPKPKLQWIPALTTAITILLIMFILSELWKKSDPYVDLAKIDKKELFSITRSSTTTSLFTALRAFENNDFSRAIIETENYINIHPNEVNLGYTHFVCGLSYLLREQSQSLERHSEFDLSMVDKAIEHFQKTIEMTNSRRLQEQAHWYTGKAFLMKRDFQQAKKEFEIVLSFKGQKMDDARTMLKKLEKFLIS